MTTFEDIQTIMENQKITETYVCVTNTNCETLNAFATSNGLYQQVHYLLDKPIPFKVFWLEYHSNQDEFTLNLSCFDKDKNLIDTETFLEQFTTGPANQVVSNYISSGVIKWTKTSNIEYTISGSESSAIYNTLISTLPKLVVKSSYAYYPVPTPPYYPSPSPTP